MIRKEVRESEWNIRQVWREWRSPAKRDRRRCIQRRWRELSVAPVARANFEKLALEYAILRLLRIAPMHGYALRRLATGLRFFYPMSNPNLYPVLRRMESEGWVAHHTTVVDNRLRKVYELTESGRAELTSWLSEPPLGSMELADPLALKIALLTDETAPIAAEWIESEADNLRVEIEQAEHRMRESATTMSKYTHKSSEFAISVGRLRLEWLQDLVDFLREEAGNEDAREEA